MAESVKYIKMLHDVGHPTIYISEDFQVSYASVSRYWETLDKLDYDTMYWESQQAGAKDSLERWRSTDWNHHGLSLEKLFAEARELWKAINHTFGKFAVENGRKFYEGGNWTGDQWRDFLFACKNTLYLWQGRVNELCVAYNYPSLRIDAPSKTERPDEIAELFTYRIYVDDFFGGSSTMKMNSSQWGKRAARYIREGKLKMENGDAIKVWRQLMKEHPDMRDSVRTFRAALPKLK